jgi:hypothetical protein
MSKTDITPDIKEDLATVRKFIEGWKNTFDQRYHSDDLGNKRYDLAALEDCHVALDAVTRIERIA